ncbi:DUF3846 domain-containing protein [Microbacterium sp. B2969]|uniref:DUF3846 domain-containing protein n=1 Tax=Microbacterium alkaliflavum TaxID=3248839 RepID=A0ABW7QDW3_9MICO
MKVIKLSTDGTVEQLTIDDEHKLTALQQLVGGYVQAISLTENVDLVMHEEEKFIRGHKANPVAGRLLHHFDIALTPGDYIAGDAVLVGVDGPDWISVPDSTPGTLEFLGFQITQKDDA